MGPEPRGDQNASRVFNDVLLKNSPIDEWVLITSNFSSDEMGWDEHSNQTYRRFQTGSALRKLPEPGAP